MKKTILSLLLLLQVSLLLPLAANAQSSTSDFSRREGIFVRPELYGAIMGELGYQINPRLQLSIGYGVEISEKLTFPELVFGFRAYASEKKWTAFFDYHVGLIFVDVYAFVDHRFTVGPSFKNFDFGGGIMYVNIDGAGYWSPCINIGYNFRIGK